MIRSMTDFVPLLSKSKAVEQGLKFYFTGVMCKNGPCERCNTSKADRHPLDFARKLGMLL